MSAFWCSSPPSFFFRGLPSVAPGPSGGGLVSLEYASRYSRGSFSPIRQKAHSHIHIFQRYTFRERRTQGPEEGGFLPSEGCVRLSPCDLDVSNGRRSPTRGRGALSPWAVASRVVVSLLSSSSGVVWIYYIGIPIYLDFRVSKAVSVVAFRAVTPCGWIMDCWGLSRSRRRISFLEPRRHSTTKQSGRSRLARFHPDKRNEEELADVEKEQVDKGRLERRYGNKRARTRTRER